MNQLRHVNPNIIMENKLLELTDKMILPSSVYDSGQINEEENDKKILEAIDYAYHTLIEIWEGEPPAIDDIIYQVLSYNAPMYEELADLDYRLYREFGPYKLSYMSCVNMDEPENTILSDLEYYWQLHYAESFIIENEIEDLIYDYLNETKNEYVYTDPILPIQYQGNNSINTLLHEFKVVNAVYTLYETQFIHPHPVRDKEQILRVYTDHKDKLANLSFMG